MADDQGAAPEDGVGSRRSGEPASPRPTVVVMGVSGSGKSTVGAALAQRLRVPYADADDFHPPANILKLTAGEPLDDDDRHPWLESIGQWLAGHPAGGVMSCSALTLRYRDQLRGHVPGRAVVFVHLDADPELIRRRQASRPGHFMPPALLTSQFDTLEPLAAEERGFVVDVGRSVDDSVESCVAGLALIEGDRVV